MENFSSSTSTSKPPSCASAQGIVGSKEAGALGHKEDSSYCEKQAPKHLPQNQTKDGIYRRRMTTPKPAGDSRTPAPLLPVCFKGVKTWYLCLLQQCCCQPRRMPGNPSSASCSEVWRWTWENDAGPGCGRAGGRPGPVISWGSVGGCC